MSDNTLVSAQNLKRVYGNNTAVSGINLQLAKGEVLGLLGPNGAGKSTTLQMLAGCLGPTSGRVLIQGVDMAVAPTRAKAQLGYLPEHPPLYPELTVDEYLKFCARLHRIPAKQRADAIATAKDDCGLADMSRRVIGNLSKGYQQRVGLAQAIVHRPNVLILDEPTVGLDPNQIREIRDLIRRLGKNHSVLLSSHILPEIQATCSRVMIIHQGHVVFDRPMAQLESGSEAEQITLGMHHPPTAEVLQAIDGVHSARQTDTGLWQLQCDAGSDPRAQLAQQAADSGWGLFELHAGRKTLEQIFAEITGSELREVA